ncbi:MAG: adenosine kinase [Cucumibacter sp.]
MQIRYDVLTIGNAIVDVLARVGDDFLRREGLTKGIMHLTEWDKVEYLYRAMPQDKRKVSGGSCANTAAGVASLGGRAAFVGKVADDEPGDFFAEDLRRGGTSFKTPPLEHGSATARSMILIAPDGERTMNTYLGACHELTVADIDEDEIGAATITFMEGFLWDPPEAKRAFVQAAEFAHKHGRSAAVTLSDAYCVDRFRGEFLHLLRAGTIDMLLANLAELKSLYQTDDLEAAIGQVSRDCRLAAITMGARGAMTIKDGEKVWVPVFPVEKVEDATGAGDLFAAGFLLGVARGQEMEAALKLGCLCASEVISHIGARPEANLKALAARHGLAV